MYQLSCFCYCYFPRLTHFSLSLSLSLSPPFLVQVEPLIGFVIVVALQVSV